MHELIIKYLSGNASSEEKQTIDLWRQQGDNEQLFNEIKQTWIIAGNCEEKFVPDVDKAWEKFTVRRDQKKFVRRKVYYSLAAAAVLIPAAFFFIYSSEQKSILPSQPLAATHETETVVYEEIASMDSMIVFSLPDSSKVWLNKNSVLSYPEKFASLREVKLTGEAFFEVKRMEAFPFIIYTSNSVTKVLGTSFNLKAYDTSNVEITVVSGNVEFAPAKASSKKMLLAANDKGVVKKNASEVVKTASTDKKYAWWKTSKKENKFKKFLNKIKRVFKKAK
jgi:ferric-dicitrate binding protein FerR (iron transport regulator)